MPTLVLVGPSGAGKTTLQERLLKIRPDVYFRGISHTTRPKRPNEVDDVHYHFVSSDVFDALKPNFVEWVKYCDHFYGSGMDAKQCPQNKVCIQVLDPQGCKVYMQKREELDAVFVFLKAPKEELVRRIKAERPDAQMREEDIDVMLKFGEDNVFDLVIDNETPELATAQTHELMLKHFHKKKHHEAKTKDEVLRCAGEFLDDVSVKKDRQGCFVLYTKNTDLDQIRRKASKAFEGSVTELEGDQIVIYTDRHVGDDEKDDVEEDVERAGKRIKVCDRVSHQHNNLERYHALATQSLSKYYEVGEFSKGDAHTRAVFGLKRVMPDLSFEMMFEKADGDKVAMTTISQNNVINKTLVLNDELFLSMMCNIAEQTKKHLTDCEAGAA